MAVADVPGFWPLFAPAVNRSLVHTVLRQDTVAGLAAEQRFCMEKEKGKGLL